MNNTSNNKEQKKDVQLTDAMLARLDEIENAVNHLLLTLLQIDPKDSALEEKFPWNITIIREVADYAISCLEEEGHVICDPFVSEDDDGNERLCCDIENGSCKGCPLR